jgi:hypothetical protein
MIKIKKIKKGISASQRALRRSQKAFYFYLLGWKVLNAAPNARSNNSKKMMSLLLING